MKHRITLLILVILCIVAAGCSKPTESRHDKLSVIATIFPLYDFARAVGGERATVSLLLPPGVEPHHFEPRPDDMVALHHADVFIYTNKWMEPWAESLLKGVDRSKLTVVDAGTGITFMKASAEEEGEHEGEHDHDHGGVDPHIWMDLQNAQAMVDTIAKAFAVRDPSGAAYYRKNAEAYKARLAALDQRYKTELADCRVRTILQGGHYAFGYLAKRYGLTYVSAYPLSADAEPGPRQLTELAKLIKEKHLHYVYYEELLSPRVAETLAKESGAELLQLNSAHTVSRDNLEKGVTFISIMEKNLDALKKGLECR